MKKRNPHAVGAWSRHGGPHSPGAKRPPRDPWEELAEGADEALDEAADAARVIISGTIEIDGELFEIELDWDGEEDDEE